MNESDRILWDPTIRRKSYRNLGDDPRDGSVLLDPIEFDYRKTAYFSRLICVWFHDVRTQYFYKNIESYRILLWDPIGSDTADPSVGWSPRFLSDFEKIPIRFRSVLYRIPLDPISNWITWELSPSIQYKTLPCSSFFPKSFSTKEIAFTTVSYIYRNYISIRKQVFFLFHYSKVRRVLDSVLRH